MVFALDICRANLGGYSAEWTEIQRRYGLMQQLLIAYYDVTPSELAAAAKLRRERWSSVGTADQLRGDAEYMRQTCGSAITMTSNLLDFRR